MGRILPFGPTQQAEYVDKELSTATARGCRVGAQLRRISDERDDELYVLTIEGAGVRHYRTLPECIAVIERLERRRGIS